MHTAQHLTQEIKSLILSQGIDMVGIASVDRWRHAPPGYYTPTYYMPEARTVISLVRHIPDGAIDIWGPWDQPGRTIGPYLHYGYGMANFDMARVIHLATKRLEHYGHKTMAHAVATFSHYRHRLEEYGPYTTKPDWSQMHAAVAAGLGEFGWMGIFISTRFGPRVRLGSIITSAPLQVDPMYDGPPLCQPSLCNHRCARECPVDAFSYTETDTIRIGDREFVKARHDNVRCIAAVSGTPTGTGSRNGVTLPPGRLSYEQVSEYHKEVHWADREIRAQTLSIIGGNYCGFCLRVCPAPLPARRGPGRGLAMANPAAGGER